VKGGSDIGLPIIISRVVPNTSAYETTPKLCEGDQVIISIVQHNYFKLLIIY